MAALRARKVRFPGQTSCYRTARNRLLEAERDLRRKLPPGGRLPIVRHVFARRSDKTGPLRNLLDFTPEGRGADWFPRIGYK